MTMKIKMKLLVLAVTLIFAFVFISGDKKITVRPQKKVLRIGVECEYAPNNWEERKQSDFNLPISNHQGYFADGYDVQIAKLVAAELNSEIEIKKISWNDLIPALNNGEIDVIFSGMLDTDERKAQAAFTDIYEAHKTEYTIIVNNQSKYVGAKKFSDFTGARIIAQKGTNLDAVIDQIPGVIHVNPVNTVNEMIKSIVDFKVDGAVINLDTGRSYEATYKNLTVIRFPENEGFVLGFTGICAAVRKNDTELLHRINNALKTIEPNERRRIMDRTVSRLWKSIS